MASSDVNFDCPHCGQNLDAENDMVGMVLSCPACRQILTVPCPKNSVLVMAPVGAGEPEATEEQKKETVKINIPPGLSLPRRSSRIIRIKRPRNLAS